MIIDRVEYSYVISYITYIIRVYSQSVSTLASVDMVRVYHSFTPIQTHLNKICFYNCLNINTKVT